MSQEKLQAYRNLVDIRRRCHKCADLKNPSVVASGKYDSDQIGPWSLWQGNLDAEILVVGQDWGDVDFFVKHHGVDPETNRTNQNLELLLREVGVSVAPPGRVQHQVAFFTNAVLCLKTGGLQAKLQRTWLDNCVLAFLLPLIEIVRPKVVISMAQEVSKALLSSRLGRPVRSSSNSELVEKAPYDCFVGSVLFPVYHCGAGSINRNRSLPEQQQDWRRIAAYLKGKESRA